MKVDIKKQFVPTVDEAVIVAFEASLGYAFPRGYREFLLRFNGGEPDRPLFTFGVDRPYGDSAVRYFYSITAASITLYEG